jgi:hypothetical protein
MIHRPVFIYDTTFWRLDSASVFRWNLFSWAQSIELVPITGSRLHSQYGPRIYPKFSKFELVKIKLSKTSNHLTFRIKCKKHIYHSQRPYTESSITQSALF